MSKTREIILYLIIIKYEKKNLEHIRTRPL